jgi:hypothetical protein
VVAVAQDRFHDFRLIPEAAQFLGSANRMRVGVAFVVEVVDQAGDAPLLELWLDDPEAVLGVPDDRRLNGQTMLAEGFAGRPFGQKLPGVFAVGCGHASLTMRVARRA